MSVHDEDEAPLDPAQERLRRKLVRLLLVSGGIMFAGLIAVFAAIVYKVSEAGVPPAPREAQSAAFSPSAPVDARIVVPPGYRIAGTELGGDRALLTLTGADGETLLILVDLASGTELARYRLVAE
jgi:hypothetical protein